MYNWERYTEEGYSEKLVNHVRDIVLDADITEIKPECISSSTGVSLEKVIEFLHLLSQSHEQNTIQLESRYLCPFCGNQIPIDSPEHFCESKNDIVGASELEVEEYYLLAVEPSRDIKWAVVIHGMNTRGAWQEDLVWKLSTLYKYSIPVFVYKYGLVQIGALLPFLQKRKVREFACHLKKISKACNSHDPGFKPDVIAHSFGTWIIANTLKQNPDIKIGRLILLGSIIRPDFDWEKLLDNGQVEAILTPPTNQS
ncbi:MAG: hypothetical protein KAR40_11790, partial [Candidatus Sabulitectum sp.]|nr:hypothetical protein [Candidatus Sabulitectum sp.]